MKQTDLAWAAGFLDGEGHFRATKTQKVLRKNGKGMRIKSYSYFQIAAVQSDVRVLTRLKRILGGAISGPHGPYTTQSKPFFSFNVSTNAEEVFNKLVPYLSEVKKDQGKQAIRESRKQRLLAEKTCQHRRA